MGLIVSNVRRQVSVEFDGRVQRSLQIFDVLQAGKVIRVKAGAPEGHKVDGSKFATAFVQLQPGYVKYVVGYEQDADKLLAMEPGTELNALLNKMPGGWYKLAEIIEPKAPEAPAAQ